MNLELVGQNWLDTVWPDVQDRLDALCKKFMGGKYEAGDLLEACRSGEMQMWLAIDQEARKICGVCLTEVVVYPRGKWGRVWFLAGERMQEWLPFLCNIEAWFRAEGCVGVTTGGRREWVRVLGRFGYEGETVALDRRF